KHSYDVTSDRVTISTIHSAKGLDWANVFIVGIDYIEPKEWSENQIRRLIYVGLTRARYRLFIPHVRSFHFIDEMETALKTMRR
ncbi:MAG: 3'-5' exonuclease, partial [Pseudomonadota bacterium]